MVPRVDTIAAAGQSAPGRHGDTANRSPVGSDQKRRTISGQVGSVAVAIDLRAKAGDRHGIDVAGIDTEARLRGDIGVVLHDILAQHIGVRTHPVRSTDIDAGRQGLAGHQGDGGRAHQRRQRQMRNRVSSQIFLSSEGKALRGPPLPGHTVPIVCYHAENSASAEVAAIPSKMPERWRSKQFAYDSNLP